jgi:carbamoyl-phosphate synthase/aspartate carbamoyltransferase
MSSGFVNLLPVPPVAIASLGDNSVETQDGVLELSDGSAFRGVSFGAEGRSVTGECIFQTGKSRAAYLNDDANI